VSTDILGLLKGSRAHCIVHHAVRTQARRRDWRPWASFSAKGGPLHAVKEAAVRHYARHFGLRSFVETGTYMGDMVYAVGDLFNSIVTVELDGALCRAARWRLRKLPHAAVVQGDSSEVLPKVLTRLTEPSLFWLDAHYSGWPTARTDVDTPIRGELDAILTHDVTDHVVLIDDACCFDGQNNYPALGELRRVVAELRPEMAFDVRDDIIRLHDGRTPPR
jgi:hypothetical protein